MENFDRFGPELLLLIFAAIIIVWNLVIPEIVHPIPWVALAGLAGSAIWTGTLIIANRYGSAYAGTLIVDKFSIFFAFLIPAVAAVVVLESVRYAPLLRDRIAEYYALVLVIACGAILMASSNDLIAIFVALELTSICQYILAGFLGTPRSGEAGLKYLLLGAVSSATLLYGMALLFGLTGTTRLPGIAAALAAAPAGQRAGYSLAAVMIAAGFGFKMALAPFQMWVPDVYEGAPTPVTAYLSVASKAAAFAVALRVFYSALGTGLITSDWANFFAVIAAVSMTVGNVLAIQQRNIKRLFGYSSIAQAGNFLVGLAAISATSGRFTLGASGVIFFLAAYAFTNMGAFTAIVAISNRIRSDNIGDYAGMARRSPWLSAGLAFCLVSLTGIPPTAGFIAKLYIFDAAVQAGLTWLAIIAVLNTVLSAYYYLGIVRVMYLGTPRSEERVRSTPELSLPLAIATAGVLVFGILPGPLLSAASRAAGVFAGH
ncbi:MAG: NADH-quinone oxidoreductase subunit N [Dehalococcoidia bacterium]